MTAEDLEKKISKKRSGKEAHYNFVRDSIREDYNDFLVLLRSEVLANTDKESQHLVSNQLGMIDYELRRVQPWSNWPAKEG